MEHSGSFDVVAFGVHFRFVAGCADAYSTLDQYAFPWLERVEAKAGRPDLTQRPDLTVGIDQAAGKFQLSVDNNVVATGAEPFNLVCALTQVLDETIIQRASQLCAVHAGVVELRGRALLFPGSTHAGKSALTRELLRRGATYFSDEYGLIDAQGYVHPYPRPLLVRNGGSEQTPLLARTLEASIGTEPVPLGWIFAIRYQPEGEWSVRLVSQGEMLMSLLGNTPHLLEDSPHMVSIFQRAVSQAKCFAGIRGDATAAVDKIMELTSD